MAYTNYRALRIEVAAPPPDQPLAGVVATATIENPLINLLDEVLIEDLERFGKEVEADSEVRVVVLQSADASSSPPTSM
jgi:enoyl-CoA hydratase/carnithine racemase